MFNDFSASEQRLGQWQQRIEQRAQRYEQARERVERIRVTETSRDGTIAVTVSSNGLLTDLQISDRTRLRPSGIGAEVMGCLRRAQAKLPELVGEAMAETVGEDTASARELRKLRGMPCRTKTRRGTRDAGSPRHRASRPLEHS